MPGRAPSTTIRSRIGTLVVGRREGALVADWAEANAGIEPAPAGDEDAARLADALRRALAGDESALAALPIGAGTPFQRRVWSACRRIPRGETRTYGELARAIGLGRGGARAIGQALRRNPLPILVPCHRVVSTAGSGGYAGATDGPLLRIKQALLKQEHGA
ncbi:MAG: methylated-DNA--[protein]-cysteine S-methyltransferase [Planctomycetota bacterium]